MNRHQSLAAYHRRKTIEAQLERERLRRLPQRSAVPVRHESTTFVPNTGTIVTVAIVALLIGAAIGSSQD